MAGLAVDPYRQVYGGTQEDFIAKGEEAIQTGLRMIRETVESKGDLKELFFRILAVFEDKRHQIAKALYTPDMANKFGRRRFEDTIAITEYTSLDEAPRYSEYCQMYLTFLKETLKDKIPKKGTFDKQELTIEEPWLGRKCRFVCTLMTEKETDQLGWTHGQHNRALIDSVTIAAMGTTSESVAEAAIKEEHFPATEEERQYIAKFRACLEKVKKDDKRKPEYVKIKMQGAFRRAQESISKSQETFRQCQSRVAQSVSKSDLQFFYIIGKVYLEINKKWYALSEYLAWGFQTGGDPIESLDSSGVWIIHQDPYLINDTLKDAASCFEKALQWDKATGDIKDLMDRVNPLVYLDWHAMRPERGGATIGEWLEQLPYRYLLDKKLTRLKKGDLLAFIAPLFSTFCKDSASQIVLS